MSCGYFEKFLFEGAIEEQLYCRYQLVRILECYASLHPLSTGNTHSLKGRYQDYKVHNELPEYSISIRLLEHFERFQGPISSITHKILSLPAVQLLSPFSQIEPSMIKFEINIISPHSVVFCMAIIVSYYQTTYVLYFLSYRFTSFLIY